jgi:hypothetical protein
MEQFDTAGLAKGKSSFNHEISQVESGKGKGKVNTSYHRHLRGLPFQKMRGRGSWWLKTRMATIQRMDGRRMVERVVARAMAVVMWMASVSVSWQHSCLGCLTEMAVAMGMVVAVQRRSQQWRILQLISLDVTRMQLSILLKAFRSLEARVKK